MYIYVHIHIYRLFNAVTFQKEGQGGGTMSLSEYENFLIAYDILGVYIITYVYLYIYMYIYSYISIYICIYIREFLDSLR
jgi:hypothetical protein